VIFLLKTQGISASTSSCWTWNEAYRFPVPLSLAGSLEDLRRDFKHQPPKTPKGAKIPEAKITI